MNNGYHQIEAEVVFSKPDEGGRKTSVRSDYRGQFHYEGEDWAYDARHFYPDFPDDESINLGETTRSFLRFGIDMWNQVHSHRIRIGLKFEIREGWKVIGHGIVTKTEVT